ncbi:MAG: carboxylating nicotinate-nucleotide diphosphorylase [Endozoicomonas sp. (ex Botrylloides leachii)]|nr:carboxylating nicotinate-nucleotide diphosphorylase [Endozoicomonas sp. (ex Botrylloides leachii)]
MTTDLNSTIYNNVKQALVEDIATGDITAELIPATTQATASIICREHATICGRPWVDEVFRQLDASVQLDWKVKEGDQVSPNQELVYIQGLARSLLTGERCAINFLQTLSGTATRCHHYAEQVKQFPVKLLDTRKTLPGLRLAQKYAVKTGGCFNHRIGLFDAFLIKENHIAACGGIAKAITAARTIAPSKPIEVEVENIEEFKEARHAGADSIMLDNFPLPLLLETVSLNHQLGNPAPKLEASGGITDATLADIAATGVDYISIGTLTKDCRAVDLSMRLL